MKEATSNNPPKKLVKKGAVRGGASPKPTVRAEPSPAHTKDGMLSKTTVSQANLPETKVPQADVFVDSKMDTGLPSHAQEVGLKPENSLSKNGVTDPKIEVNKEGAKPKTKTVIVKRKIIVKKKVPASYLSVREPANTSNEMEKHTESDVMESVPAKEVTKEQVVKESPLDNAVLNEEKQVNLASENPQKVVKKVPIAKGKGGTKEAKKDNKQEKEQATQTNNEVPVNVDKGFSAAKVALPYSKKEEKNVEAEEFDEHEMVDTEGLQLYDDQEFEEEPIYEEEVEEEEGADNEEEYRHTEIAQSRPVSERQKRKKLEVFVGGLDKDATEDDLRAAFKPVGEVVEVRLMMNPVTGKNKGYAFVRFATAEQAGRAATEFSSTKICGKECGVLPNQDNDTLFIGNISRDWKSSEVLQKLQEFGIHGIEELTLMPDSQNEALNRGYAFLELATHYDAVNAFQRLQRPGVMFGYDRPAKISWAQPLNEPNISVLSQVKSVFVDGIPSNLTDEKIKQSFGKFGEIERIVFARNMPFAKRKDFAFVNFATRESALACAETLGETELSDGDRTVKVKVSLTRPLQKGRVDKWGTYRGYPGQGRGQSGRGEGWFSTRFGTRGGRRGWSGTHGIVGRGGKRLYDEDEVRMLLRTLREEEGWPSGGKGRGDRHPRISRGMARGGYGRNNDSKHYDSRHTDSYKHHSPGYTRDTYSRPVSDLGASRGKVYRTGVLRNDFEPQNLVTSSRSSVVQSERYLSPRHEGAHHQRYEQGSVYDHDGSTYIEDVHDYNDVGVGMKRPVPVWDEDPSFYESSHRGYPRARVDYSDPGLLPENATQYPSHTRSPTGPVTQGLGMRQGRSGLPAREGHSSFYDGGSGLGKAGASSTYNDHSYNTSLPETTNYLPEAPERRETSMYPSSLYGGHTGSAGYDLQNAGYY